MQVEFRLFDEGETTVATTEEWREVVEFPGYEVSNMGRFRRKETRKLLAGNCVHNGYIHIGMMKNCKQEWRLAHRVVAITFLEPAGKDQCVVNHKNHVRHDNRVSNLEWATRSHNAKHAHRK